MLENIVLIFIVFAVSYIILRVLYYNAKLKAAYRYRIEYLRILEVISKDQQDLHLYDQLAAIEHVFVKLFKEAGEYNPLAVIIVEQPIRYGALGPTDSQIRNYVKSFSETIGYFLARRNETLSLVYWIQTVINWARKRVGNARIQ